MPKSAPKPFFGEHPPASPHAHLGASSQLPFTVAEQRLEPAGGTLSHAPSQAVFTKSAAFSRRLARTMAVATVLAVTGAGFWGESDQGGLPLAGLQSDLLAGRANAASNRPRVVMLPVSAPSGAEAQAMAMTRVAIQRLSSTVDVIEVRAGTAPEGMAESDCIFDRACVDTLLSAAKADAVVTGVVELAEAGSQRPDQLLMVLLAPRWPVSYVERRVALADNALPSQLKELLAVSYGSVLPESTGKGAKETISLPRYSKGAGAGASEGKGSSGGAVASNDAGAVAEEIAVPWATSSKRSDKAGTGSSGTAQGSGKASATAELSSAADAGAAGAAPPGAGSGASSDKAASDKESAEKAAAEKAAAEKAAAKTAEKASSKKSGKSKSGKKSAAEKAAEEKAAQAKLEEERLAQEKAAQEKAAQEKAEAEAAEKAREAAAAAAAEAALKEVEDEVAQETSGKDKKGRGKARKSSQKTSRSASLDDEPMSEDPDLDDLPTDASKNSRKNGRSGKSGSSRIGRETALDRAGSLERNKPLSWPLRAPKGDWKGVSLEVQVGGSYGALKLTGNSQVAIDSSSVVAGSYRWVLRENAPAFSFDVQLGYTVLDFLELGLKFTGMPASKSIVLTTYYPDSIPDYTTDQSTNGTHFQLGAQARFFLLKHSVVKPYAVVGGGVWLMPGYQPFDPLASAHALTASYMRPYLEPGAGVKVLVSARSYFALEARLLVDPGQAYLEKDLDADDGILVNELVVPPDAARSVGTFHLGFGFLL